MLSLYWDCKGFYQIFHVKRLPENSFVILPALVFNNFFTLLTPSWNQFLEDSITSVAYNSIIYSLLTIKLAQYNLKKTIYVETGDAHCLLIVLVGVQCHEQAELN